MLGLFTFYLLFIHLVSETTAIARNKSFTCNNNKQIACSGQLSYPMFSHSALRVNNSFRRKVRRKNRGGSRKQRRTKVIVSGQSSAPEKRRDCRSASKHKVTNIDCRNINSEKINCVRLACLNCQSCRNKAKEIRHIMQEHVEQDKSCHLRCSLFNAQAATNKTTLINDLITEMDIDIMIITESWLKSVGDDAEIEELTPSGYKSSSFPRLTGIGDGVLLVHRNFLTFKNTSLTKFKSFEGYELRLQHPTRSIKLIAIYRPPPSKKNKFTTAVFLDEFEDLIDSYVTDQQQIILLEFLTVLSKKYKERTGRELPMKFEDSFDFAVKKEGWGGGGSRQVRFVCGSGDIAQLKPSSKVLTVSIGPGLPKTSRPGRKPVVSSNATRQSRRPGPPAPQGVVSGRSAPSRRAPAPPGHAPPPPISQPPSRKQVKRQSSKDIQANLIKNQSSRHGFERTPTLPQETDSPAKRAAAQRANNNNNTNFMQTPDAGVAGAQRQSIAGNRPAPAGGRPRPKAKPKPKPLLPQCRCLYAYDAQDTDELSFNLGDTIDIMNEDPSGWWIGKLRGKEGLFPANYVEKI
ncbi:unconventional myosin-Ie [Elysia marginata]|uniref:Unconventional myosin-Ie n=1 Tax=Elysia marginata TaxID=1093978 RepID=A0AAV4EMK0_9GAST|nr:unconventional myosin-Ie [Elysia marginata]